MGVRWVSIDTVAITDHQSTDRVEKILSGFRSGDEVWQRGATSSFSVAAVADCVAADAALSAA